MCPKGAWGPKNAKSTTLGGHYQVVILLHVRYQSASTPHKESKYQLRSVIGPPHTKVWAFKVGNLHDFMYCTNTYP